MKTYIASNGDTWDSIAFKVYGDEFMCDELCMANARSYSSILMFHGGEEVNIPEIVSTALTVIKAPWE